MRELTVLLEGRNAGTLSQDRDGAVSFTYRDEYASDPDATPLSVSMPTSVPKHGRREVNPWMSNLLPDNERVLQRWGQEFKVSPSSPFRLLEQVGGDVAGAARLLRPGMNEAQGDIEWLTDDDVSALLAELSMDPAAWTPRQALGHFSLAGTQAKTALRRQGQRWGRPSGSEPTTHILKPSTPTLEHQALNEHLCLSAALHTQLRAARTSVEDFGSTTAIVVERYDRAFHENQVLRVHQEDMCQALSVLPAKKYQHDGGPSVADIAALLRRAITADRAAEEVTRFVKAIAFSWVIAGTDAHAKNYSLMLSGPQVRLAPLYDVHSALPYLSSEPRNLPPGRISVHTAQLAMRIGAHYGINAVRREDWAAFADDVGMAQDEVLAIVGDIAGKAPEAFARVAANERAQGLLDSSQMAFADRLAALVERRAKACATLLIGHGPHAGARRRSGPPTKH